MNSSTSANPGFSFSSSIFGESVLTKKYLDFSSPWHFSDVVLVVEDTKFHVHKSTLSMWSPVFEAMFASQFLESTAKEIPLPGKRAKEVKDLLKVIYSSWSKPRVTEKNYQSLLQLANEYQMDQVKRLCSEFLLNKIQVSNCLDFFKTAEQFGLDDVREKCYEHVCYNSSSELEDSEHFNGFEPEFKVDICMRVIKELERTLEEYVTTCSDLVQEVYKEVYENFYEDITLVSFKQSVFTPLVSRTSTNITKEYRNTEEYKGFEHGEVHRRLQNKFQAALAKAKVSRKYNRSTLDPKNYNTKYFDFSCSLCLEQVQAITWENSDIYDILKKPVNKLHALQQAREAKKMAHNRMGSGFFSSSSTFFSF